MPWGLNFWMRDGYWKWEQHFRRWQCLLVGFWSYHPGDWQWRGREGRKLQVINPSSLSLSPLSLCSSSPPLPILCVLISSGKSFLSLRWGGRFGAEEDRFLVVPSTLRSSACPELVKCILNDLLEHQEGKVLDRFCTSISGISSRDSQWTYYPFLYLICTW